MSWSQVHAHPSCFQATLGAEFSLCWVLKFKMSIPGLQSADQPKIQLDHSPHQHHWVELRNVSWSSAIFCITMQSSLPFITYTAYTYPYVHILPSDTWIAAWVFQLIPKLNCSSRRLLRLRPEVDFSQRPWSAVDSVHKGANLKGCEECKGPAAPLTCNNMQHITLVP